MELKTDYYRLELPFLSWYHTFIAPRCPKCNRKMISSKVEEKNCGWDSPPAYFCHSCQLIKEWIR